MKEEKCLSIYSHKDVILKFSDEAALNQRFLTCNKSTEKLTVFCVM
jgi:hypothetical protein